MKRRRRFLYADDDSNDLISLLKLRAPSLILGLLLGVGISFVTSNFEAVLARNVQVAYFLPFIVYIADAIGTQTEAIYSRDLRSGRAKFSNYLRKELTLGIIFGSLFSLFSGIFSFLWLQDYLLSLSVGIASFFAIASAPIVALLVAHTLQSVRSDPAAGTGPIATVLQDMLSVIIYGLVASIIIL